MGGLRNGIEQYSELLSHTHISKGRVLLGYFPSGRKPASVLEELAQRGQCGVMMDLALKDGKPVPGHYSIWGPREFARLIGLGHDRAVEELIKMYPYRTWRKQ